MEKYKMIFIDDDKNSFGENGLLRKIAEKQAAQNNMEAVILCTLKDILELFNSPKSYKNIRIKFYIRCSIFS